MIAAIALRYAGPGALLVARPTGVTHVYVGPTTPSGRHVPRSRRTVCRAHTRRLTVLNLDQGRHRERVCARCAACLSQGKARQAAHHPRTRGEFLAVFAGITLDQLASALLEATTTAELDRVGHLSLLLHGHKACQTHLIGGRPFTKVLGHRRRVLTHDPSRPDRLDELVADGHHRRRAERQQLREERIDRLLNSTAKPRNRN